MSVKRNYINILIWSHFGAVWLASCSFGHLFIIIYRQIGFMCFIQPKLNVSFLNRTLLSTEVIIWSSSNIYHSLGIYLMIFVLNFPHNRSWHFMQTISIGGYLHKMSNIVFFLEKIRKLFQNVIYWKLMFSTLWAISADSLLMIRLFFFCFLLLFFFQKKKWHLETTCTKCPILLSGKNKTIFQIVCWKLMLSTRENASYNILNHFLFFWEKYHQFVDINSAELA